jgi:hypothetical protein
MSNFFRPFFTCYDDNTGGTAGGAGAGTGTGTGTGAGTGGESDVKNQADLNAVLKREKEKFRLKDENRAKELEDLKNTLNLTAEQKTSLESQIEELRTAHLTEQEKAKRNEDKLNKDWQGKLDQESHRSKHWESQFTMHKIGAEITGAAVKEKVIPQQMKFLEAYLAPRTRLVENQGDDSKPNGTYTAKVRFDTVDKAGKPVTLDLTVPETVKAMKELPEEYGYLFEAHTQGGLGGGTNGSPGGRKPDPRNMSTGDYLQRRKKDPASLGLT